MSIKNCYKLFDWQPMAGLLDNRSSPEQMAALSYRLKQNTWSPDERKFCRRPQWERLFPKPEEDYNNEDLHDQLLALQTFYNDLDPATDPQGHIRIYPHADCDSTLQTRTNGREPVTLILEAISSFGSRKLIAGTQSRIYVLNERTGNWKLIADGFGKSQEAGVCPRERFYATLNQNAVLFTNNYNAPFFWKFDEPTSGCAMQAWTPIPDLDLIGLTKAAVCWTWKGVTFLADVEMDGLRHENRVVWSDYNNLSSYDPSKPESITGFQDLEHGEKILGGLEQGDFLLIYTTRRIWQVAVVGGEGVFNFQKKYSPGESKDRCLFYRNTLISDGENHFYLGVDGIYAYNLYTARPERIEWMHVGSKELFDTINPGCCDNHIAEFNTVTKELWFSWSTTGNENCCPDKTLVVNLKYPDVSTVDFGFTAFTHYQSDPRPTIRDFILDNCICTPAELNTLGHGFVKEGLPRVDQTPSCTPRTSIYSNTDIMVDGAAVEDYTKTTADTGSLCDLLGDSLLEDLCGDCDSEITFIGASSEDLCLKQIGEVYLRERCTNPAATGTTGGSGYTSSLGTYADDPYTTKIRTGPMGFGANQQEKEIGWFGLGLLPELQVTPLAVECRIGRSAEASDPNNELCAIVWDEQDNKVLECQDANSEADHESDGTRAFQMVEWPMFYQGYFLYWELTIAGVGGPVCFNRATHRVRLLDYCHR